MSGRRARTLDGPGAHPSVRQLLRCVLLLAATTGCVVTSHPAAAQQLTLRFFDVGQGDAALITSPEGKTLLVDAGPEDGVVNRYLGRLHIDTLDLIVASHNHADHITGLQSVLRSRVVRFYMDNGVPATTHVYASVLNAVQHSGATYLAPTARTIHLGSVVVRVIPPMPGIETQNNTSVGLLVTYGTFSAFFAGDAESVERGYWLGAGDLAHVTVLKVAHHGSSNGTDARWLAALSPCVAVISVGVRNRYGHPSPRTLRLLDAAHVLTFRTDRDGTVEVRASRTGQVVVHTFGVAAGTARAMRIASDHFSSARTGTGSTMRSARPGCPVTQH